MIRFLLLWPLSTLVLLLSFLFPDGKRGEFGISRQMVREFAFWMIGIREFT